MKKLYIKVGFIIIGLITLSLGVYGANHIVHADEEYKTYEIYFDNSVDQVNIISLKLEGMNSYTINNDNTMNDIGPMRVLFNANMISIETEIANPFHIELMSKDYSFNPTHIDFDPSNPQIPVNVHVDYDPNHLTSHALWIKDSANIEKSSFAHNETATVSFDSAYPNYVVYYSLQDEGTWQEAVGGTIELTATANQAQDRIIEYRFAGYYDNEMPPTLNDLQDERYLKTATVHFNAVAADANDETTGEPPINPGDNEDEANNPGIDDNNPDNPDDPGNDDNDYNNPNDSGNDNNPNDSDFDDNDDPETANTDHTETDDNNQEDIDNKIPDNSAIDNNDPNNYNNNLDNTQNTNITGANTGDYTNVILWVMVGGIGYFCIVYPIRKRMNEHD